MVQVGGHARDLISLDDVLLFHLRLEALGCPSQEIIDGEVKLEARNSLPVINISDWDEMRQGAG